MLAEPPAHHVLLEDPLEALATHTVRGRGHALDPVEILEELGHGVEEQPSTHCDHARGDLQAEASLLRVLGHEHGLDVPRHVLVQDGGKAPANRLASSDGSRPRVIMDDFRMKCR